MSCYIYFDRDQFLLLTSIDQSSEIPPYAEGYRDVIDDEVVSFSYSYTVVIYVRTGFLCYLNLYIDFSALINLKFINSLWTGLYSASFFLTSTQLHKSIPCQFERFAFYSFILLVEIKDKPAKRY